MNKDLWPDTKIEMFLPFHLSPTQGRYHTIERESLAVVKTLGVFDLTGALLLSHHLLQAQKSFPHQSHHHIHWTPLTRLSLARYFQFQNMHY